jgi:hypothetical protein
VVARSESGTDLDQSPDLDPPLTGNKRWKFAKDAAMQKMMVLAAIAGMFGLVAAAAAGGPVAVVEDVKGQVAGVEFMDYVAAGKVIKLGAKDSIVLGYMNSCWRETITGGVVVVGEEQSTVYAGTVERSKVDCDSGQMQLSERQAKQSAGTVFRGVPPRPEVTLYGLSPMIEIKDRGPLIVERLDKPGERYEVPIRRDSLLRGRFYDFAKSGKALVPNGLYAAQVGAQTVVFKVDAQAKRGPTPIVGRLVRFE